MNPTFSLYIDVMRIVAAGLVLATHLNAEAVTGRLMWRLSGFSTEGVVIFFVLSGLVISHVVARRETSARAYAVARVARIYSVAVLAVLVTMAVDAVGVSADPSLYIGQSYYRGGNQLLDAGVALSFVNEIWGNHVFVGSSEPFWSLGFEVWYYVIFGVAQFMRGRGRVLAVGVLLVFVGPKIVAYLCLWLLGVGLQRNLARVPAAPRGAAGWGAGLILFAGPVLMFWLLHRSNPKVVPFFGGYFAFDAISLQSWCYYMVVGVLFCLHLLGARMLSPVLAPVMARISRPVRWAAGASFTLYLVHQPVLLCLASVSPYPVGGVARLVFVVVGTLAAVVVLAELGERRKALWRRVAEALVPGGTRSRIEFGA